MRKKTYTYHIDMGFSYAKKRGVWAVLMGLIFTIQGGAA